VATDSSSVAPKAKRCNVSDRLTLLSLDAEPVVKVRESLLRGWESAGCKGWASNRGSSGLENKRNLIRKKSGEQKVVKALSLFQISFSPEKSGEKELSASESSSASKAIVQSQFHFP
jgi:hypothetical protein